MARTGKGASAAADAAVIEVDEITLDGRTVRVRNLHLDLDLVLLDPENPRIANTIRQGTDLRGKDVQKRLQALLWEDPEVRRLYSQIMANGGLIERIIVREDHRVAEGNCRTVVYRKLREKFPDDVRWRHIPARVLPRDFGERDTAILLGEMHVAGKNSWTAFEKAGHLHRLHTEFALTQKEIAQRLRMSKSKVNQLIRAFDLMRDKFLARFPGKSAVYKFSYFAELFKKPDLREWIKEDTAQEEFVSWVGESKITQGSQVRELPRILDNPQAKEALSTDGFTAAQDVLAKDDPALTSPLLKTLKDASEALKKADMNDIKRVSGPGNTNERAIVSDLKQALDDFVSLCRIEDG